MKRLRKFLLFLFILMLVPAAYVAAVSYSHTDLNALPPLESGDLVFETALTNQSTAIMLATGSLYTHVGIIEKKPEGLFVVDASRTIIERPLSDFIQTGWGERITVKRYPGLSDAQREALAKDARTYLGRHYNYVFYMKSQDIYCSQLPYLVFQSQGLALGTVEKIGELHVNNAPVHKLFKSRWQMHPACQKPGMDYDSCWKAVLEEPIITPVSIERDAKLQTVYSNYLF